MIRRYDRIPESLPITVIYGENSWIDQSSGLVLREKRENSSYVHVEVSLITFLLSVLEFSYFILQIIPSAGHHVYSDQPTIFNRFVRETCRIADSSDDKDEMLKALKLVKEQFDPQKIQEFIQKKSKDKELNEQEIIEHLSQNETQKEVTTH